MRGCIYDDAAPQFTGKERDTETGLDYFGARYYGANMGRWMSPDWSARAEPVPYAKLHDPQTLNLYAYVGNNPLSRADLDGHCWFGKWGKDCPKQLPPPDTQHNHAITFRKVAGQGGNAFGHGTVQIDKGKEVGYGPKKDMTKTEIAKNTAVPGQVEPRAANVKTEDQVTYNVTEDQAKAAQKTIDDTSKDPGNYVLRGNSANNCATFDERVAAAAGINAPHDVTPGSLIQDMRSQQYEDNSTQPTNPN